MAIPFKSPISFGSTTLSEDNSQEFKIKAVKGNVLTLGLDTAGIETYDGNSIWLSPNGISLKRLNGSNIFINQESINLTSGNLSVYDLSSNNLLLNCNTTLNTFGNDNYSTMIKGNNLYLYRNNEPIIEAADGSILIGDSINQENYNIELYGKSLTIDSPNINITKKDNGSFIIPPYTQLSSIAEDRPLRLQGLACIDDINNSIINKIAQSHVWKKNQPIIFVVPGAEGTTKLEDLNGVEIYTFGEGVDALIGIRTGEYQSGSSYYYSCTFIEIKNTEFNFIHKDTPALNPWTWTNSNNSYIVYISNYSLL